MAIPKAAKKAIAIGGLAILVVLLAVIAAYWLGESDSGGYIERNPHKIIAQLEKILEVDFPENIKNVKAAKVWIKRENWVGYIIKFTAEPNMVDGFLKFEDLKPYDRERDYRDYGRPTPEWFTKPIQQGKTGNLILDSAGGRIQYGVTIYIDTSDARNFVVYVKVVTIVD